MKDRDFSWPERFNEQLLCLDGKYWGVLCPPKGKEGQAVNVIVESPDNEIQGELIE